MIRINKYIAQNTYLSRRQADEAIKAARVTINSKTAGLGDSVDVNDVVTLDNSVISTKRNSEITILLNKPIGYVCSRDGQGSPTVYDLIPEKYHNLNIAGRLDKDSSGLVVLTSSGELLNELTHPSNNKDKVYEVRLNRELTDAELNKLLNGVDIGDKRPSKFASIEKIAPKTYKIVLKEGRNRQIRRTIDILNAKVRSLVRLNLGEYSLKSLNKDLYKII